MQVSSIVNTSYVSSLGTTPADHTQLHVKGTTQVEKTPDGALVKEAEVFHMEVPVYKRKDNSPYEIYKENSSGYYLQTVKRV